MPPAVFRSCTRLRRVAFAAVLAVAAMLTAPSSATAEPTPGTLVAVRDLPAEQYSAAGAERALFIEYWTVGPGGAPMLSTGTLFVPRGEPPKDGWPVLARAHGTTGIGDRCAPTALGLGSRVQDYIGNWLNAGFAVVATDYVGLGTPGVHPYLDGTAAANSVIDSVRAARAAEPDLSTVWGVAGLSQGGHAALFTAHSARSTAPELDFRGAVAVAPPSNLELVLPLAGPYVPRIPLEGASTYLAYVFVGLRAARPDLDVNSYLTPLGRAVFDRLEELCVDEADAVFADVALGDLFARPLWDSPLAEPLRTMIAVPTSGYDRPILLVQGTTDSVVPPPATAKLYLDLLAGGTDVRPDVRPAGHIDIVFESQPEAIAFMRSVVGA